MENTIDILVTREDTLIKVDRKSFDIGRPEEVKLNIEKRQLFILYDGSEIPIHAQEQLLSFSETIRALAVRDDRKFPYYKGKMFDVFIPRKYTLIIENKSKAKT